MTAGIELAVQGSERGIAEVDASLIGVEGDALGGERVEGVTRLEHRALDVRQRQRGEMPEPALVRPLEAGPLLVDSPREGARHGRVPEMNARRPDRQHRARDTEPIHDSEGFFFVPLRDPRHALRLAMPRRDQRFPIEPRQKMRVRIDPEDIVAGVVHVEAPLTARPSVPSLEEARTVHGGFRRTKPAEQPFEEKTRHSGAVDDKGGASCAGISLSPPGAARRIAAAEDSGQKCGYKWAMRRVTDKARSWRPNKGLGRQVFVVTFAYIYLFQALFAAVVADRMALADPLEGAVVCSQDHGADNRLHNDKSGVHPAVCDLCIFHALTPLAPEPPRATLVTPSVIWPVAPGRRIFALASPERHEPRTSQGPPRRA